MSDEKNCVDIQDLKLSLPTTEQLAALEVFYKAIADPTRLKILMTITTAGKTVGENGLPGEVCVHNIAEAIGMSQSAVSHQLRVLRHANLITKTKSGKHAFYTLSDNHVVDIIEQSLEHILEEE